MDKWHEFLLIVITSILLVSMLYIFKGYIPIVDKNHEGARGKLIHRSKIIGIVV